MKLHQSNSTMKAPCSLFVAGLFGLLALSNSAQAVITVSFAQSGSNVTATLSGTLQLPDAIRRSTDNASSPGTTLSGGQFELYALLAAPATYDIYGFGTYNLTGLFDSPDSFSGPASFGFLGSQLLVNGSASPDSILTPTGTWTWNTKTIAGIGLGSLTTTPFTVHETALLTAGDNQDSIQFVLVPEPSSSVLLGLGVAALLFRRRRLA